MYKINADAVPVVEAEPGVCVRVAIGEEQGAPNFHLRVFTVAPGANTPLHEHPWEHEVFILRGGGVVVSGDRESPFVPHDAIYVAPNERHQFRNTGDEDVQFICVIPATGPCVGR